MYQSLYHDHPIQRWGDGGFWTACFLVVVIAPIIYSPCQQQVMMLQWQKSFDPMIISSICSPSCIWEIKVSHTNIYLSNGTGNSIISEPQISIQIQSRERLQQTHSTSPGTSFTILPHSNLTRNKSCIISITLLSSLQSTAYNTAYHLLHLPYLNHT